MNQLIQWIKRNYEVALLVVSLMILLGAAMVLVVQVTQSQRQLDRDVKVADSAKEHRVEPLILSNVERRVRMLKNPPSTGEWTNRSLVSAVRVYCISQTNHPDRPAPIPFEARRCPWCGTAQPKPGEVPTVDSDGDGIPDRVEEQAGLNPNNASDARRDKDGDGFSNREEYEAGTDLTDPDDHPTVLAKLRVLKSRKRTFPLQFSAVSEIGERYFQLEDRRSGESYLNNLGEPVGGTNGPHANLLITNFIPAAEGEQEGPAKDQLVLADGEKRIRLTKGEPGGPDTWVARLGLLTDGSTYQIRMGTTNRFGGTRYKVVDITSETVTIESIPSEERHTIPSATAAEARQVETSSEGRLRDRQPEGRNPRDSEPAEGADDNSNNNPFGTSEES